MKIRNKYHAIDFLKELEKYVYDIKKEFINEIDLQENEKMLIILTSLENYLYDYLID